MTGNTALVEAADAVFARMQELTTVRRYAAPRSLACSPQAIEHPFRDLANAVGVTASLARWTIDDVAWLVEAALHACSGLGHDGDVTVAVRRHRSAKPADSSH